MKRHLLLLGVLLMLASCQQNEEKSSTESSTESTDLISRLDKAAKATPTPHAQNPLPRIVVMPKKAEGTSLAQLQKADRGIEQKVVLSDQSQPLPALETAIEQYRQTLSQAQKGYEQIILRQRGAEGLIKRYDLLKKSDASSMAQLDFLTNELFDSRSMNVALMVECVEHLQAYWNPAQRKAGMEKLSAAYQIEKEAAIARLKHYDARNPDYQLSESKRKFKHALLKAMWENHLVHEKRFKEIEEKYFN